MIYSDDSYLAELRSPIMAYGVTSWLDQHEQAGRKFELDIDIRWYRFAAKMNSLDPLETPFEPEKLLQGYDYVGSGTVSVSVGDIIVVPVGHTAGGTLGDYYESLTVSGSTNLTNEDYTGAGWSNVTDDRVYFRDVVSYYALHLAYRFLADKEKEDDYADQREYWMNRYQEEMNIVLSGDVGYDFDGDGVIDSTEKSVARYRLKRV